MMSIFSLNFKIICWLLFGLWLVYFIIINKWLLYTFISWLLEISEGTVMFSLS